MLVDAAETPVTPLVRRIPACWVVETSNGGFRLSRGSLTTELPSMSSWMSMYKR